MATQASYERALEEQQALLDTLRRWGETALTLGTGALGQIGGGLHGLATLATTGDASKAAQAVDWASDELTYRPRTKAGQEGVQAVSEVLLPIGEALEAPSRWAGDTAESLGAPPWVSTLAYSTPAAAMELVGAGYGPAMARGTTRGVMSAADAVERGTRRGRYALRTKLGEMRSGEASRELLPEHTPVRDIPTNLGRNDDAPLYRVPLFGGFTASQNPPVKTLMDFRRARTPMSGTMGDADFPNVGFAPDALPRFVMSGEDASVGFLDINAPRTPPKPKKKSPKLPTDAPKVTPTANLRQAEEAFNAAKKARQDFLDANMQSMLINGTPEQKAQFRATLKILEDAALRAKTTLTEAKKGQLPEGLVAEMDTSDPTQLPYYDPTKERPLREVITHPDLQKHYPDLLDKVMVSINPDMEGNIRGLAGTRTKLLGGDYPFIELHKKLTPAGQANILAHEIQHQIQTAEGFAKGGMPKGITTLLADVKKARNRHRETLVSALDNAIELTQTRIAREYVRGDPNSAALIALRQQLTNMKATLRKNKAINLPAMADALQGNHLDNPDIGLWIDKDLSNWAAPPPDYATGTAQRHSDVIRELQRELHEARLYDDSVATLAGFPTGSRGERLGYTERHGEREARTVQHMAAKRPQDFAPEDMLNAQRRGMLSGPAGGDVRSIPGAYYNTGFSVSGSEYGPRSAKMSSMAPLQPKALLSEINKERAKNGLPPLTPD